MRRINTRRDIRGLVMGILLSAAPAMAEVEPYRVFLSDNSVLNAPKTWTVPAGKVLIVESIQLSAQGTSPSNSVAAFQVHVDNLNINQVVEVEVGSTYEDDRVHWLDSPVTLKAGEKLLTSGNATYRLARYYGTLIDESDLYAQNIPVELSNPDVSGSQFVADARYASPRPRITTILSTTSLSDFAEDPSGVERAGPNRDEASIAVEPGSADDKFLSVIATARK